MSTPLGTNGIGLAAGWAYGAAKAEQANAADRERALAEELARTRAEMIRALAAGDGAQAVVNEMVRELKAEAAGEKIVRRVSDPANRDARIAFRDDAEEDALNRLSGGQLKLQRRTVRKPK